MELYETSSAWRDLTSEDPTKYHLDQATRALLCLVKTPDAAGYAYVESVHLDINGNRGKALMVKNCDLIECVYGLSGHKAWWTVGGHPYPIDKKMALIALHTALVYLWVEGESNGHGNYQFPKVTVKKCMLQADDRLELARGGQVSL